MIAQTTQPSDRFEVRLSSVFAARAVRLALSWHMEYAAQLVEVRKHTTLFSVKSRDGQREYDVVADRAGAVWCVCPAGIVNHACCHAGAAILLLRKLADASKEYAAFDIPASNKRLTTAERALHAAAGVLAELEAKDYAGADAPLVPMAKPISIFK